MSNADCPYPPSGSLKGPQGSRATSDAPTLLLKVYPSPLVFGKAGPASSMGVVRAPLVTATPAQKPVPSLWALAPPCPSPSLLAQKG